MSEQETFQTIASCLEEMHQAGNYSAQAQSTLLNEISKSEFLSHEDSQVIKEALERWFKGGQDCREEQLKKIEKVFNDDKYFEFKKWRVTCKLSKVDFNEYTI